MISYWTQFTLEQERVEKKLMHLGVKLFPRHTLSAIRNGSASIRSTDTSVTSEQECAAVVLVTDRVSKDELYYELAPALTSGKLRSLRRIGDAEAPNLIAQAVFSGHLAARNFDETISPDETPFKVERMQVS